MIAATSSSNPAAGLALMFGLGILFVAYWFPTLLALIRHHQQTLAIGLVNLLAGWTVIGWFAALLWACTSPRRVVVEHQWTGGGWYTGTPVAGGTHPARRL